MTKNKSDMAQIPYIVHKCRMYKAYKRETRLKWAIVIINIVWASLFVLFTAR